MHTFCWFAAGNNFGSPFASFWMRRWSIQILESTARGPMWQLEEAQTSPVFLVLHVLLTLLTLHLWCLCRPKVFQTILSFQVYALLPQYEVWMVLLKQPYNFCMNRHTHIYFPLVDAFSRLIQPFQGWRILPIVIWPDLSFCRLFWDNLVFRIILHIKN